ncbi:MAG: T9SS type A sorting domain-containing protein [Bacteroidia bacterium]|nr:T9SS type A sorting domain-containing protein [Bacteroidia bacterium]
MKNKSVLFLFSLLVYNLACFSQGDSPCTATPVTINAGAVCGTYTSGTTVGATYSNNAANGGTPTCASPGAPDVWYSFVAPSSGIIQIYTSSGTITDGGMALYSSSNNLCSGTLTSIVCDDDSGPGTMPQIGGCGITPGNTYFLRFWQYGGSGTGTFNICFWDSYDEDATSITNCAGGTQVCNNNSFTGNSSGAGNTELTACNAGCLGGENNSSWYWINIGTTGNLEMTITPSNGTDDYDFAIWGPVNACPPATAPVRCNYAAFPRAAGCGTNTNPTGMTAAGTGTSASACQNRPYLTPLAVTAGQIYVLLVDGYTPSAQPFDLNWGGTAGLSCTPIVLPIELINFTGKPYGKSNIIEWTTATEINNDYFTLEKSLNGIDFDILTTVKGAGMSSETKNYVVTDPNPFSNITYYRLKQTDYNGKYSYSEIIAIENSYEGFAVSNIHPNPTNSDLYFDFFTPTSGVINIQVLDYTGRIILEENVSVVQGKTNLNTKMGEFSKGIYSLKVTFDQTGYSSVNMIIKQ